MRYLAISMCLVLLACQKNATPTESPETRAPAPRVAEPAAASDKPGTQEERDLAMVGQACVADHVCPGYLRCYDAKCAIPPAISGVKTSRTPEATFRTPSGDTSVSFSLEMAVDDRQRARGLMFRRSMLPEWGMLFVYEANRPLSFWMKNTYIPLDMVFIDQRGVIVGILENVPPLTLEPRSVGKPARYVLELGSGIAAKSNLKAGMVMTLKNVTQDAYLPFP